MHTGVVVCHSVTKGLMPQKFWVDLLCPQRQIQEIRHVPKVSDSLYASRIDIQHLRRYVVEETLDRSMRPHAVRQDFKQELDVHSVLCCVPSSEFCLFFFSFAALLCMLFLNRMQILSSTYILQKPPTFRNVQN